LAKGESRQPHKIASIVNVRFLVDESGSRNSWSWPH
jgi:hypothetical protein